ncbi:MAG: cyclic pyranopterin monophosphate synthase MoaC [Myxococcota bacterium]
MARRAQQALTHLDERGAMHMVDVGDKPATHRMAIAEAEVHMGAAARRALASGDVPKGDALAAARLAGIQAAKRTAELIPLCHPLPLTHVSLELVPRRFGYLVRARTETSAPTGVEMEALTAVTVAALTLYDMLKAVDRAMHIEGVKLLEKRGGRSGHYVRRPRQ